MNKLEIDEKENLSVLSNQNSKKHNFQKDNIHNLYFQYVLSKLKLAKTINGKKNIIDSLITTIKNNNEIIKMKESRHILLNIYKLIQLSISDNNIPFILSQLTLINLLIDNLYNNKKFILFFKRILPKLFDKFYSHNENINNILLILFNKSLLNNILTINDYYVYIENITLEDDNNYISNVLNFFYLNLKNNNNLTLEAIPENIINIIRHKDKDNEKNSDISKLCRNILLLLKERKNKNFSSKNNIKYNEDNIFQTIVTNFNDLNEKNEDITLNSFSNEIMYLEGNNSLIKNEFSNKKENKNKEKLNDNNKLNKRSPNNSGSSTNLINFGVSRIDPPQDSDLEEENNLFTLTNQNNDNSNDEIFQKTPVFSNFEGSDNLIKKNLSNSNKEIEEVKPINLQEKLILEDENYRNIKLILGNEIINLIKSVKLENKINGLKLIFDLFQNNKENKLSNLSNINDLIEYLKIELNIFKETDFNIITEVIKIINHLIIRNLISKEHTIFILSNYYEKILYHPLKQYIIDLINSSNKLIGLSNVIKLLISKLIENSNNNKLLIEYSNYFLEIINKNNSIDLPAEELIEFSKKMLNNNIHTREYGIKLLCGIYKFIGKEINYFLKNIEE